MMKKTLLTTAALSAFILLMPHAMAQEKVGTNAVVEENSKIELIDSSQVSRDAKVSDPVYMYDNIVTGDDDRLQVLLLDEKSITVGPNAEFLIDEFSYNPIDDSGKMVASITKGTFRFMSGKPSTKSDTTLNTPVASMGVRGTIVEGAVGSRAVEITRDSIDLPSEVAIDEGKATLIILRGPSGENSGLDNKGALDVLPDSSASAALLGRFYAVKSKLNIDDDSSLHPKLASTNLPVEIASSVIYASQDRVPTSPDIPAAEDDNTPTPEDIFNAIIDLLPEQDDSAPASDNSVPAQDTPPATPTDREAPQRVQSPNTDLDLGSGSGGAVIRSGDAVVVLSGANTAVFIPYPNGPIYGPFVLSKNSFNKFSEDLRTIPFGAAPSDANFDITIARGSGDEADDGDFGFPWIYENQTLTDRPDVADIQFTFPPGPPICPPGGPTCP